MYYVIYPHVRGAAAKRSYPTSDVRGSGRECQAAMTQEWPRGATPGPRSGVAAQRSYSTSKVRGGSREYQAVTALEQPRELPHARGQGRWPGGVQGAVAARAQEGLEELFHVKVRRGGGDKIPLIQGKEQQLRFTGAAVKRYPMSKVRETQERR